MYHKVSLGQIFADNITAGGVSNSIQHLLLVEGEQQKSPQSVYFRKLFDGFLNDYTHNLLMCFLHNNREGLSYLRTFLNISDFVFLVPHNFGSQ